MIEEIKNRKFGEILHKINRQYYRVRRPNMYLLAKHVYLRTTICLC